MKEGYTERWKIGGQRRG